MKPDARTKHSGDVLTAKEFRTVNENIRMLAGGGGPGVTMMPGGMTISTPTKTIVFREPAVVAEAYNIGADTIGVFGCAQLTTLTTGEDGCPIGYPRYVGRRALEICTPVETAFGRFVIAAEKIEPERAGKVWIAGVCPAWFGNILGSKDDRWRSHRWTDRCDTYMGKRYLIQLPAGAGEVVHQWGSELYYNNGVEEQIFGAIRFGQRTVDGVSVETLANRSNAGLAQVIRFAHDIDTTDEHEGIVKLS